MNLYGLTNDISGAHAIIETLKSNGLQDEQVSVVQRENSHSTELNRDPSSPHYRHRIDNRLLIGCIAGAALGALLGLGATLVPTRLLAMSLIAAVITGAVFGGITGGVLGAIAGAGVPRPTSHRLGENLHPNSVLLVAHPRGRQQVALVKKIYAANGATVIPDDEIEIS